MLCGYFFYPYILTHSQLLEGLKCESQTENNERVKSRGTFPGSQHFGGVEGVLKIQDGIRKSWQASLTHTDLHKTNIRWLVHSWNTFGARTSHRQHEHTRLTTVRTWGKPPPSPLIIYSIPLHGAHIQMAFCPGIPKWEFRNRQGWDFRNFGVP
jgi:hypothetical protein